MGNTSGGMMSLFARNTNTNLQSGAGNLLKRTRNALLAFSFIAFQVFSPIAIVSAQSRVESAEDSAPASKAQEVQAAATPSVANPPLTQSCGLDIALVIDNSTSISASELGQMKTAMTSFTNAFSGTPTQFSVTRFATNATVLQAFTSSTASVNASISSIPVGGGYTNWEDGLMKAQSTFDPRPSVPNMVIFASDGDPTESSAGGVDTNQPNAHLAPAVTQANAVKTSGTRILALGIGNPTLSRLQAISGPNVNTGDVLTSDVITTDFANLADELAEFANQTCGGTITTTKLIDQDGNLNTTGDRAPAQNWSFDINGSPSNPNAVSTDVNGQTPAIKVDAGTYSVNETQQAGYQLLSANCSGATNNGSIQGNSVTGVVVATNNIVSCTFINSPKPKLIVKKHVVNDNGGTKSASDFTMTVTGNSQVVPNFSGNESGTEVTLNNGSFSVNEISDGGYSKSFSGDCNGTISAGETKTCTITNDDIAPKLTVIKNVVNPYGSSLPASSFPLFVNGNFVTSGTQNAFNVGSYTISETQQTGYSFTGISGDCSFNQDTISVLLSLADNYTCTLTNTAIQPKLVVIKHVINDNSGTKTAADFTMTVSGNSQVVPNFAGNELGTNVGLNEGNYSVDELADSGYTKSFSGDCSGTISIGQTKYCTVTNNDIAQPSINVVKSGPDSAHEGDEVTYTFTVTNTGDVALSNIDVVDSIAGEGDYVSGDTNDDDILQTTETWIFTATYVIPDNHTANVTNTVTACGDENVMLNLAVNGNVPDTCDTDYHELDVLHPSINVEKYGPETAYEGEEVSYTFVVTNTGDTPLAGLTVQDSIAGGGVYQYGDINTNGILETTETWVYWASYTIPTGQTENVINTVEVCSSEYTHYVDVKSIVIPKGDICDTDTHELDVLHPSIKIEKSGPASAEAGDTVNYTFKVTNTGDTPLSEVTVDDSITADPTYVSGDVDSDNQLDLTETWIYTVEYLIPTDQTDDVINAAIVCGYDSEKEWENDVDSFGMLNRETPRDAVCDDDSHTLKITVPVVPAEEAEETLAPAGAPQTLLITLIAILNVTLAVGTVSLARRRLYNN